MTTTTLTLTLSLVAGFGVATALTAIGLAQWILSLQRRVQALEEYVRSLKAHTEPRRRPHPHNPPADYEYLDVPVFLKPQAE